MQNKEKNIYYKSKISCALKFAPILINFELLKKISAGKMKEIILLRCNKKYNEIETEQIVNWQNGLKIMKEE